VVEFQTKTCQVRDSDAKPDFNSTMGSHDSNV
jgi:hypothetical protein